MVSRAAGVLVGSAIVAVIGFCSLPSDEAPLSAVAPVAGEPLVAQSSGEPTVRVGATLPLPSTATVPAPAPAPRAPEPAEPDSTSSGPAEGFLDPRDHFERLRAAFFAGQPAARETFVHLVEQCWSLGLSMGLPVELAESARANHCGMRAHEFDELAALLRAEAVRGDPALLGLQARLDLATGRVSMQDAARVLQVAYPGLPIRAPSGGD